MGLATTIKASARDLRAQKLRMIQEAIKIEQDRRLVELLSELSRVSSRLNLPNHVADTAAKLLRLLYRQGLVRKSNAPEYIAASVFAAARLTGFTLTMKDVVEAVETDIQLAWHAYRRLVERVRVRFKPLGPAHYVSQVVSRLKLSSRVENLALRFTQLLVRSGLAQGKPPQPLAAAAVYLASILLDEKRNQSEVAQAVGVSDATIRNRYRDIVDNFYIEVLL
jgi:transcription initiation factor TFIIB